MSYLSGEYIQCETIQSMMDDQFVTCPVASESIPALEAIIQTQKANGIAQTVSPGGGKVRTVNVIYQQRLLESRAIEGSGARTCSASTETYDSYATYQIDPSAWIRAEEKFTVAELATVCTTDVQGLIAKKINMIVDVLERKVATKTAQQLVALYGKYGTHVSNVTADELAVSTFISTATKQIDHTAMADIDLAKMQTGYCAPSFIVGGSTLYQYGKAINAGCCSTTGVNVLDMANQFGQAYMYDKRVADALGSNDKSIMMQAGSVALIHYNEADQVPGLGANYAKFKVFAPRTGLPIDIVMSDNCGTISIIGYVNTKLVGMPTDMFAVGDEYRGVTFVNKIKVVNPA